MDSFISHAPDFANQRLAISQLALLGEEEAVKALCKEFPALPPEQLEHIKMCAQKFIENIRTTPRKGLTIETFLQSYRLETAEGIALLCLSEALLRIPDVETQNLFIEEILKALQWEEEADNSSHQLISLSRKGLSSLSYLYNIAENKNHPIRKLLAKMVKRLGEPMIRIALKEGVKFAGQAFVFGKTIEEALKHSQPYQEKGYLFSYDMLGEGARTFADAERYFTHYLHALQTLATSTQSSIPNFWHRPSISIKLSALHPRYEWLKREDLHQTLLPKLIELGRVAKTHNIGITLDAEEAARLDLQLEIFTTLLSQEEWGTFEGIGIAVQSYQKRALAVIEYLLELGKSTKRRIPIRLVKGAYWDAEIKRAQFLGLSDYPVFTQKHHTDLSYLCSAHKLLEGQAYCYPQFATHNAYSVAHILEMTRGKEIAFEFQRLYGMGETLHETLITEKHATCRIYAPVGPHQDLLSYLIRRMLENGASTSFVHQVIQSKVQIETLTIHPLTLIEQRGAKNHPLIPLPQKAHHLPPSALQTPLGKALHQHAWSGVEGVDPNYYAVEVELKNHLLPYETKEWTAASKLVGYTPTYLPETQYQPSCTQKVVGYVTNTSPEALPRAIEIASQAFQQWKMQSVEYRAQLVEAIAEQLLAHQYELMALCIREAGKTYPDAIAELREAVDFCRYYAAQARTWCQPLSLPSITGEHNTLSLEGRGIFVCISPWNFPMAIFMGQITAALVMGNSVIAKPAEQTPLIAHRLIELCYQAGIPEEVLQLVLGPGETVGPALLSHPLISGVAFTGSTETAWIIAKTLANRRAPLANFIAETGGINAMIVDSTALLEQATDDIITSAFSSAGQRCSALRVLYVQEEIADKLLAMLQGAMATLQLKDPWDITCDIGPIIDEEGLQGLKHYCRSLAEHGKHIASSPLPAGLEKQGYYLAPQCYELPFSHPITKEAFGPILHVKRYRAFETDQVIEQIRSSGYGLTFGIHTRRASFAEHLQAMLPVGNVYINRSTIGAVVGCQPFGGNGLSGTGPKAGGPFYLLRFCQERTISTNLTAIGGNISLLESAGSL